MVEGDDLLIEDHSTGEYVDSAPMVVFMGHSVISKKA